MYDVEEVRLFEPTQQSTTEHDRADTDEKIYQPLITPAIVHQWIW